MRSKIVEQVGRVLPKRISQDTQQLFDDLKADLQPWDDGSLSKGTLNPVRNIIFHYGFTNPKQTEQTRVKLLLAEMRKEPELRVRANAGDNSFFRYRYTFADAFRSKLVESYLTTDLVDKISKATAKVIEFTDSLMADLAHYNGSAQL